MNMHTHRYLFTGAAFVSLAIGAVAQATPTPERPSFEVASVKANKSGDNRMMFGNQPGGGITVSNMPLRELMTFAYEIQEFQLVGARACECALEGQEVGHGCRRGVENVLGVE